MRKKSVIKEIKIKKPKLKQSTWDGFPKIGWWLDASIIRFYHGIHRVDFDVACEDGIKSENGVKCSLEPNSSLGHAALHKTVTNEYGMQTTVPYEDRYVLIIEIAKALFIKEVTMPEALTNKALYDKWVLEHTNKKGVYNPAYDQQYYALNNVGFPKGITSKFIVGYMIKPTEPKLEPPKRKFYGY